LAQAGSSQAVRLYLYFSPEPLPFIAMSVLLAFVLSALSMMTLQGCGGAGPTPSSTPTPAPTPAPTVHHKTQPMSASAMVDYLNKQYMGFDETDPASPIGLVASMASQPSSFYKNIFCSVQPNPLGNTSCSEGRTDCRMSASLYNHKMLISSKTGSPLLGLSRATGYVFNHTLVENQVGRCSYVWDGASDKKYNVGCGGGAPGDCGSNTSAFADICPSTGKICTATDPESVRGYCKGYLGGTEEVPPTHEGHDQCSFPGPAIDYRRQAGWKAATSYMRDMATNRTKFSNGSDSEGPNVEKWNEVVIDERLLLPLIDYDPAVAIPAFLYVSGPPQNKQMAQAMRDEFCKFNSVDKIPIIQCIKATDTMPAAGPFSLGEPELEEDTMVV